MDAGPRAASEAADSNYFGLSIKVLLLYFWLLMFHIKAAPALERRRIASRPGGKSGSHAGTPVERPRTPNKDRLGSTVNMFSGREPWFCPFTVDLQPMVCPAA